MYRSLVALTLAVVVAACSDDSGSDVANIDQMRVVKVSGDQSARVPDRAPSASLVPAIRYAVAGEDGWTDSALVARVEDAGEAQATITGPVGALVPAGTPVHWRIQDGGGKLFAFTTETDDSAYTFNRWAPGTVAGTYHADAGRLIGDSIVIDATWELVVLPGAPERVTFGGFEWACVGDTIDLRNYLTGAFDEYNNRIDVDAVRATADANVSWQWLEEVPGDDATGPSGTGWTVEVPDLAAYGFTRRTHDYVEPDPDRDYYSAFVRVQVDGSAPATGWSADVFVAEDCPNT